MFLFIFFFKQKTAYEMRISDWSSDVCSSDLGADENGRRRRNRAREYHRPPRQAGGRARFRGSETRRGRCDGREDAAAPRVVLALTEMLTRIGLISFVPSEVEGREIGRESCRERVCKDGSISGGAG